MEVQAFTFDQLRTPFAFFVVLGGIINTGSDRRELIARITHAYLRGLRAKPLSYRAWEARFATPLREARAELALV